MIKPTVGRVLLYYRRPGTEPQAAMIAKVWSDAVVNLMIVNEDGSTMPNPPTSIPLVQEGEPLPAGQHCRWMPS